MKIIEHFTSGLANSDTDVSTSYDDDFGAESESATAE